MAELLKRAVSPKKNLVFTSAGNKSALALWVNGQRDFDLFCVYYASGKEEELSALSDYFACHKGAKFPNLLWVYQNWPELIEQYERVYIATHSYFDPQEPAIVGLAVARNPLTTTPDNGFLSQSALLGEPFNNQLVVLSGCETSLGKMMAHDGLQSLAYGVLTAGADSVISTRWKVSDKPTAVFMQHFYQGLKQSGSSTEALRHARQQMQRHPRFKHPMHWAGFTLTVVDRQAEFFSL